MAFKQRATPVLKGDVHHLVSFFFFCHIKNTRCEKKRIHSSILLGGGGGG